MTWVTAQYDELRMRQHGSLPVLYADDMTSDNTHLSTRTICGTHVQAILDQKKLTRLAGEVREGQNMAQNGPRLYTFLASEPSRGP